MSDYTPKNPETLTEFNDLLKEYNLINDKDYVFYFDYDYPSRIDYHVYEESTADSYGIWIMKNYDDPIWVNENVYYSEPGVDELFHGLDDFSEGEKVVIHCELDFSDVEYYIREELESNYYNYQLQLEDEE